MRRRGWGSSKTPNHWNIRSDRILIHSKDIRQAVIQSIPFFQVEFDRIQAAVTQEMDGAQSIPPMAFLGPVHQRVTRSDNGLWGDDPFSGILAIITKLVVHRTIQKGQQNETLFVQQSSSEKEPDVVAADIGRGGIVSTSTNRLRMPVMQMLAPPSMREG